MTLDLSIDHRRPFNGDHNWPTPVTLAGLCYCNDRKAAGLLFGGGAFELKHGSEADGRSIARQLFFLEVGVVGQHGFTPPPTLLQPYVIASFSYLWMIWDDRRPVPVDNGTVGRDSLEGIDGCAGGGGIGLADQIGAGVDNTFFHSLGYVSVRGGLSLAF